MRSISTYLNIHTQNKFCDVTPLLWDSYLAGIELVQWWDRDDRIEAFPECWKLCGYSFHQCPVYHQPRSNSYIQHMVTVPHYVYTKMQAYLP